MDENKKGWDSAEALVSELVRDMKNQSKRWFIAFLVTLATLVITNTYWIYVFNSYEYVSQDGEGYNYYNSKIEGDVSNGAEN